MSYEKLGFTKGQTLKAEHLNHIEDGIAEAGGYDVIVEITIVDDVKKETLSFGGWNNVVNAITSGRTPKVFAKLSEIYDDGTCGYYHYSEFASGFVGIYGEEGYACFYRGAYYNDALVPEEIVLNSDNTITVNYEQTPT